MFLSLLAYQLCGNLIYGDWSSLPLQFFQAVVPLSLLLAIWKGRVSARYLLAVWCVFIFVVNISTLQLLPLVIEGRHFFDAGMVVLFAFTHFVSAFLSFWSSAITGLINFRIDEVDLA